MSDKNTKKEIEWSIYIIAHTNFNVSGHVKYMLDDICKAGKCEKVSIFVCVNATDKALKVISGQIDEFDLINQSDDTIYLTQFYKISPKKEVKQSELEKVETPKNFDIYSSNDLLDFFNLEGSECSKKKMLITWDHGNSVGIFKERINNSLEDFNLLTPNVIDDAINKYTNSKPFDLMLMMNCYMQYFAFGYALRKSVNYLIAPQNFIFWSSYNYREIFSLLYNQIDIEGVEFSKSIVALQQDIIPRNSYNINHVIQNSQDLLLLCTDLSCYEEIAIELDRLGAIIESLFIKKVISHTEIVELTEKSLYSNTSDKMLLDFGTFLINFIQIVYAKNELLTSEIIENLNNLIRLLLSCKVSQFIGKRQSKFYEDFGNIVSFSIYFPYKLIDTRNGKDFFSIFIDEKSRFAIKFSKEHKWDNLVEVLLNNKTEKLSFSV